MNIHSLAALAAVSCIAVPLVCRAAPAAGPDPDPTIGPVTVTATRTPVPEAQALATTIVIDRAEIERSGATDVADILQQYAGLEIARNGGAGQPASLFLRGGDSNFTVVLIDGVRTYNATTGAAPLMNISPAMIERIEVVEGPRAALYGPDAVSGVINIITRKPGPAQLDASLGGGSYDAVSGAASLRDQGTIGGHRWGAVFGIQQQHIGGFPTFDADREAVPFRSRTFNGRGRLELGPVRLEVRAWDTNGKDHFHYAPATPLLTHDFHHQILALEATTKITSAWTSSLSLSRSLYRLEQVASPSFARVIRPEVDWHNVFVVNPQHRLSFGLRAGREHVDTDAFGQAKDSDYGYLQDEIHYRRHHGLLAVNYLHDGQFGERFDWNAAYGYDLFAGTRLVASMGSAFRVPTATDLYIPGFSNPDLKPEKAINYELALRQQITPHQHARLGLFRTDVRDYIAYDSSFIPQNVQSVRLEGIQAKWRYRDARWDARVSAIWQDPRNRSLDKRLLRRARLIGSAQVTRHFHGWYVGANVRSSSGRPDIQGVFPYGPTRDGGYAVVGLSAGARLDRRLWLNLRLRNAFNHHYEAVSDYNTPGSAVFATLRYTLPL